MADSQFSYPYGRGNVYMTSLADRVVATAVRSPQLDMYSPSLLRHLCDPSGAPAGVPIIHLGDAGNIACRAELEAHFDVMGQCRGAVGAAWVMAPGNHDGYFMGNEEVLNTKEMGLQWARSCSREGNVTQVLSKDRFVNLYVDALKKAWTPPQGTGARVQQEGGVTVLTMEGALLTRAAWKIDRSHPRRSWLLQEINLATENSGAVGIVLDTSQYDRRPSVLIRNAGVRGGIEKDQQDLIERWVSQRQGPIILFGHHPISSLNRSASRFLADLVSDHAHVVMYVSAHTHAGGFWSYEAHNRKLLELNVGSTVDWPIEVRDFELKKDEKDRSFTLESPIYPQWEVNPPFCRENWQQPVAAYTSYVSGYGNDVSTMRARLLQARAAAWQHLFKEVGSVDPAKDRKLIADLQRAASRSKQYPKNEQVQQTLIDQLLRAEREERSRPAANPILRGEFRLCQGYWASRFDSARGALHRLDKMVRFPFGSE